MGYLPYVTAPEQSRVVTNVFRGINTTMYPSDGEWQKTRNLSTDYYPLLAPRRERIQVTGSTGAQGLIGKSAIYEVRGGTLYANGNATALTGLSQPSITASDTAPISPSAGDYWFKTGDGVCRRYGAAGWEECRYPQKQLVSMGAYIVIFPDGKYYNTMDASDYGSINAAFSTTGQAVEYSICKEDGSAYENVTASDTAPTEPTNGQLWINTSLPTHALYQWSAAMEEWVSIPTTYVRIEFSTTGTMTGFQKGDGITFSGAAGAADIEALNGSHVLQDVGGGDTENDYIVITGLLDAVRTQTTGTVGIERTAPRMDFVLEAGNRLWGCKYGLVDGENVNELYCCKLGDFKNWNVYAGISTDAWAASVGSDGPWTGAINYLGYPTFFKADRMHRISISSAGAHQVSETACRGVAYGCEASLAMVDEVLYYVGRDCICAYNGALPESVSERIPGVYTLGAAGSLGKKYYLSARKNGAWHLMVLDTQTGCWLEEDGTQAAGFERAGTELIAVTVADTGTAALQKMADADVESGFACGEEWMAESGIQGYEYTDHKYLSRFDFRMRVPLGGSVHLEMEYDSSGLWEDAGTVLGNGLTSFILPVRPRRCDHVRYRLTGRGDVRIYSVSRVLEVGSDV